MTHHPRGCGGFSAPAGPCGAPDCSTCNPAGWRRFLLEAEADERGIDVDDLEAELLDEADAADDAAEQARDDRRIDDDTHPDHR
jgi:hypothetical protein